MKKLIIICLAGLLWSGIAWAGSVGLAWTPLPDQADGVRIYIGLESEAYTNSHDAGVGVSETTVANLITCEEYFFAAKAYDSTGNYSGYSNEVSYIVPGENVLPELPPITVGDVTVTIQIKQGD